jgi:nucleotide sugar dehydrogenase
VQKVCIQGLGFVGAAMAVAVASARDAGCEPLFQVVGVDLPTPAGKARIDALNRGQFPFEIADEELAEAIMRAHAVGNLRASADPAEYEDCDVVVVDVHLDVDIGIDPPTANLDGFRSAIRTLADRIRPGTLILIETTVPPGTTERLVVPELQHGLKARGLGADSVLVAHSYERVMPGRDYLASITRFWRVYSGVTPQAADACESFLKTIVDTSAHPLTRLSRPVESETAKLMENSFRAVNIAMIDEWGRFAERAGVDLMAVIQAIRLRPTHQNMMRPGFGVGGYCLTKDPLLLGVGARDLLGISDLVFPFCETAVKVNQAMPRATVAMVRDALGGLAGKRILLLGATYREDVADTRHSPSSEFVKWVRAEGGIVDVHDPHVDELEEVGEPVMRTLPDPAAYDGVVFAVGHAAYRNIDPNPWLGASRPVIIDANSVLSRPLIAAFQQAGCYVRVIGRGDL